MRFVTYERFGFALSGQHIFPVKDFLDEFEEIYSVRLCGARDCFDPGVFPDDYHQSYQWPGSFFPIHPRHGCQQLLFAASDRSRLFIG
jgi:hypothetical protein